MNSAAESFGRYQVRDPLGGGGFAEVYRAYDPDLAREVALKVILPHFAADEGFVRRFLQEMQLAAGLSHPNIIPLHDVGRSSRGRPFCTMSLLRGEDLRAYLVRRGPLPLHDALGILTPLASALDYLDRQGLVHRDLKPANIMLTPAGDPILIDFGIARSAAAILHLTQTGTLVGTPQYMAPEQIRGGDVGPAADRYALGLLAYELLAGHAAYDGDTAQVLYCQVNEPPPLERLPGALPSTIRSALAWALQKDPNGRPATAAAFIAALRGDPAENASPRRRDPALNRPSARTTDAVTAEWTPRPAHAATPGGRLAPFLLAGLGLAIVILALAGIAAATKDRRTMHTAETPATTTPQTRAIGGLPVASARPLSSTAPSAAPAPSPPAPPPPAPGPAVQEIGVSADDSISPCCLLTVERAESIGASSVRLFLSFDVHGTSWAGDNKPSTLAQIYLVDEHGRRSQAVEVTGSAADDAQVSQASGWYRFAPLSPDARWVWLHYPSGDTNALVIGFDLGAASPSQGAPTPPSQTMQVSGTHPGCCQVTVQRAENDGGGTVRLLLSFIMNSGHHWTGDAQPDNLPAIFLEDSQGRRYPLLEVDGPSAADDSNALTMGGWYRFAPLPAGTRQARLHYGLAVLNLDLGAAAP